MSEDLAATEAFAGDIPSLESLPIESLVSLLLGLQQRAVTAAAAASEQVRAAVTPIAERMANGARWHTIGAGSSGRIAALDAVELYPTFGLEPSRICIHLAGGDAAFLSAVEGAEDDAARGSDDAGCIRVGDVAIGVSASGRAPYVRAALRRARERGAVTVAISNDPEAPLLNDAQYPILLQTGAEPIAGSTRTIAGTAQKIVMNALSTAVMISLGSTFENMMVDLVVTNEKLRERALRMVMRAASVDRTTARDLLDAASGSVKLAIVMAWLACDALRARNELERHWGKLGAVRPLS